MATRRQILDEILLPSFLTNEQKEAITARGGRLLVSASAGSGKTFVLSARVVYSITREENPSRLDRILVVTFTKAAAKEMKMRIASLLRKAAQKLPGDPEIEKQLLLLDQAHITTIDAFCLEFLKNHFEKAGFSQDFRLADRYEMEQMWDLLLEDIFERHYQESSDFFQDLVDYFDLKGDQGLKAAVLKLYDFIRNKPFPMQYLDRMLSSYQTPDIFPEEIMDYAEKTLVSIEELYRQGQRHAALYPELEEHLKAYYKAVLSSLQQISEVTKSRDWDRCYQAFQEFSWGRRPPATKLSAQSQEALQKEEYFYIKPAKELFKKLKEDYFFCSKAEFLEDQKEQLPYLQKLIDLTKEFAQASERHMHEKNILDFIELEQTALRLLWDKIDGKVQKTELGRTIPEELDEIFVDEFQDVNPLQDMLFSALSREETNLFFVGDRKQSIYRFRMADPDVFLKKQEESVPYSSGSFPARITLAENFRSRREIIDMVNAFFSKMMRKDLGKMNYEPDAYLKCGIDREGASNCEPEVHLLACPDDSSALEREASYIAKKISDMCREGYPVCGRDGKVRPCQPGDFAILMRSQKEKLTLFAQWLKEYGIDGWTESTTGYFSSQEVSWMLNLLKVIDNPFRDIPLLSVLLSPIFSFTPDEVTEIRLQEGPKAPLYLALLKQTTPKVKSFLELLEEFRRQASLMSIENCIQTIYDRTMAPALFGAMESSEQKLANLRLLLHYAKTYEQNSRRGLSGFLRYIEQVEKNKKDFPAANLYSENRNAVRIMTIHKSKGLEFPIVFLAGCSKQFNFRDIHNTLCLSDEYGLTAKHAIPKQFTRYATLPYRAACLKEKREMLGEEMRILYVGMTRAMEKLFFVLSHPDPLRRLISFETELVQPLPSFSSVQRAGSFSDWLYLALFSHPHAREITKLAGLDLPNQTSPSFPLQFVYQEEVEEAQIQKSPPKPTGLLGQQKDFLLKKFQYQYPYLHLVNTPAKLSVTQIVQKESLTPEAFTLQMPRLHSRGLTAAERGTANHIFFQFADFEAAQRDLEKEIDRLRDREFLSHQQAQALYKDGLQAFLHSPLMDRLSSAKNVEREFRFFYEMPAQKLYPGAQGENILLQGIADCLFWEEDGVVILDYKTNRLTEKELTCQYAMQLQLYKKAIEHTLGQRVKECLIYSLHLKKAVAVDHQMAETKP